MVDLRTVLVLCVCSYMAHGVVVKTRYGAVQGQTHLLQDGKQVNSFLGIQFAKPPVDKYRWAAPVAPEPWKETFKADMIRSACMQQEPNVIYLTHLFWEDYSEDCLHLNVFTPQDMSKGPYPVFVWFHGGSFTGGANFQYPGHFLAAHDVIVVVPNYRLGAFGFVSTGDSASPGNYGLLDQQMALQFVRDNIKQFGGDPSRVTTGGQSAGAASVGFQTVSPMFKGLFQQAILQSGSDLAIWSVQRKEQKPWTYTEQLAKSLNCTVSDTPAMMACLRERAANEIIDFSPECTPGFICLGFGPVVDGVVIPDDPYAIRNRSEDIKVPSLVGITSEEGSLFAAALHPGMLLDGGVTQAEFNELLSELVKYILTGEMKYYEDVYRAVRFYFTPWGQQTDMAANRKQLTDMLTDAAFGFTADQLMKHISKSSTTFSYLMRYRSANASELLPEWIGVPHSFDLPYVFGNNYVFRNPSVLAEMKITHDLVDWNSEDDNMTDFIMMLWTNFIKTGNPTPEAATLPGNAPLLWKPYEEKTQQTFVIDRKLSHETRWRQQAYALFTHYLPYLLSK